MKAVSYEEIKDKRLRRFIWFVQTSWHFKKGKRLEFFTDFVSAWRKFNKQQDTI